MLTVTTLAIVITLVCSLAVGAFGGVAAARGRRTLLGVVAHIACVVIFFSVVSGAQRDFGPYGRARSVNQIDRAAWNARPSREKWEFRLTAGVCAFVPTLSAAIAGARIARRRAGVE